MRSFPDLFFAGPLGFGEEPYYEDADDSIQKRTQGRIPAVLTPMRIVVAAIAALLAIPIPQAAAADERILSFDSQIAIQPDGKLDVTETIHVRAENVAINHGIFRDFPTRYDAPGGRRVKVGFDLVSTWLDGQPEPANVEALNNGVRIRIGSADRTVSPGEHSYTIRYHATRMIGRFGGL